MKIVTITAIRVQLISPVGKMVEGEIECRRTEIEQQRQLIREKCESLGFEVDYIKFQYTETR